MEREGRDYWEAQLSVVSFITALLLFRIAGCFDQVFCNYYITLPTALLLAFVTHMGKRLFDGYKKKQCQDTNQDQTTVDAEYWNPDTNKWERCKRPASSMVMVDRGEIFSKGEMATK